MDLWWLCPTVIENAVPTYLPTDFRHPATLKSRSMTSPTAEDLRACIATMSDPETGRPLDKIGAIGDIQVDGNHAKIGLKLSTHSLPIADEFTEKVQSRIAASHPGITADITVEAEARPVPRLGQFGLNVRSVILVSSGKGGVGKSTVAASIALVLRRMGARVGLMDADVYGPSIPHLLGLEGRPAVSSDKKIQPIRLGDMPVISMGFLVEPDQAVIWRGPMLHGSITQFLRDTDWGTLDYLVVDMPPGTGDIALTLSQAIPLSGAVVVCTPQEVALLDAVKAISMFRKVDIPLAGMVENMSGFVCPDCHKQYDIFGAGGARERAEELQVPFLGGLPINIRLREAGDEGKLAEALENDGDRAPIESIVRNLVSYLAQRASSSKPSVQLPTL